MNSIEEQGYKKIQLRLGGCLGDPPGQRQKIKDLIGVDIYFQVEIINKI